MTTWGIILVALVAFLCSVCYKLWLTIRNVRKAIESRCKKIDGEVGVGPTQETPPSRGGTGEGSVSGIV